MLDWDRLLEQHGPMVWRTSYRLLGSAEDAQDCLQDTFLSALKLSRREPVKNWPGLLRRLATSRALDRLRRRVRRQESQTTQVDVSTLPRIAAADPVQAAEAEELASRLREALGQLPPRQAEVFVLRFLEEMKYREIAEVLGLDTNAVSALLHDARARLRAALDGYLTGGEQS